MNFKITNFRSIGSTEVPNDEGQEADIAPGVDIEMDDNNLVFLCGCNNAGKSNILAAYETFVVANKEAEISDFYEKDVRNSIVMEVSIRAETEDDRRHQALERIWDENGIAKIRKTWRNIGEKGVKESFEPGAGWREGGAGGFDTLLQNACPTPIWIKGESTPEEVIASLRTLVQEAVLKAISAQAVYADAVNAVRLLGDAITGHGYSNSLKENLNSSMKEVFPGIRFSIGHENPKEVIDIFKSTTTVGIEEDGKPALTLANNGHGLRRQFVMGAFRGMATQLEEAKKGAKQRRVENMEIGGVENEPGSPKSKMLLIEEPELFLHPSAVRSVRDLLYLLATASEFQVMAATHSPVVVDLSKPHTTLVRVSYGPGKGTTIHQVSNNLFDNDERETMKMLNYFDPYVCEAFFSDRVILVEGDTEAVAIRRLIERMKDEEVDVPRDIHVVNCGTKMNIPFFQKVLSHFRINHVIFHDLDRRENADGRRSAAWTMNQRIWDGVVAARGLGIDVNRFVFNSEFESANGYVLNEEIGKPHSAYLQVADWDMADEGRAAIRFLRLAFAGNAHEPDFTPEQLEQMAG
ncbi:AAA family ATPase [Pseudoxanthomonas beigongshangi]|uniref:AAA family ATPase n=1 Tax=Pseudoxanthomonas beigongshangi TaxID=2782537 RepID=UPI00193C092B|nr:AAA family ATPase [Pseudoxanthomonas beigongshangi]